MIPNRVASAYAEGLACGGAAAATAYAGVAAAIAGAEILTRQHRLLVNGSRIAKLMGVSDIYFRSSILRRFFPHLQKARRYKARFGRESAFKFAVLGDILHQNKIIPVSIAVKMSALASFAFDNLEARISGADLRCFIWWNGKEAIFTTDDAWFPCGVIVSVVYRFDPAEIMRRVDREFMRATT